MSSFNPIEFRTQFPALEKIGTYLDSAATALKCKAMINTVQEYYTNSGVNINRGSYALTQTVTAAVIKSRETVASFINAASPQQIVWTKGTTESLNMIAMSYLIPKLQPGDEIIVSTMEHHSNLLPWIMAAKHCGAHIIPWSLSHHLAATQENINILKNLITPKTRLVAVTQMSNVTGYQPPLKEIVALLKQYQIPIAVDGAQGVVHHALNVQEIDIDFYAFSAHKLYSATGVGVLYIKQKHLPDMLPYQVGGKMLTTTSMFDFIPAKMPEKLEAGTQNIAGILGFNATLDWLMQQNNQAMQQYLQELTQHTITALLSLPNIELYHSELSPIISFNFKGHHHHDIATLLAEQSIAIRDGEHCAQPFIQTLGIAGCLRVSLAPYNTANDIEQLITGLHAALAILE